MKLRVFIEVTGEILDIVVPDRILVSKLIEDLVKKRSLQSFDHKGRRRIKYVARLLKNESELHIDHDKPLSQQGIEFKEGDVLRLQALATPISSTKLGIAKFAVSGRWNVEEFELMLRGLREVYEALLAQDIMLADRGSRERLYTLQESYTNIKQNISSDEKLLINKIIIQSPGWIEVIGKLNPLETIRQFINDWREAKAKERKEELEREKGKKYKDGLEEQMAKHDARLSALSEQEKLEHERHKRFLELARLRIEIEEQKNNVARSRATMLQEAGYKQEEIRPFIEDFLRRPLEKLPSNQLNCERIEIIDSTDIEEIEEVKQVENSAGQYRYIPAPSQPDEVPLRPKR